MKPDIHKLLKFNQLSINSLLELTNAINQNCSEEQLISIFEFILIAQFKIKKLALLVNIDFDNLNEIKQQDIIHKKNNKIKISLNLNWTCRKTYGISNHFSFDFPLKMDVIERNRFFILTDSPNNSILNFFNLVLPVIDENKVIAFLLISWDNSLYKEVDNISFIQTLSNVVFVAIKNKRLVNIQIRQKTMEKELELAAEIQKLLLPDKLPENKYISVAAQSIPYHEIGGDYYDVIRVNENEYFFCIADVSGKGAGAALLMANFQANLRALIKQKMSLKNILKKLNSIIFESVKSDKFITFFIANYNIFTKRLIYINAGHNYPVIFTKKQVIELKKGTTPVGAIENMTQMDIDKHILKSNDILFLYTDGLTESTNINGNNFSIETIYHIIDKFRNETPLLILEKMTKEFNSFLGISSTKDDIAMLCLKVK